MLLVLMGNLPRYSIFCLFDSANVKLGLNKVKIKDMTLSCTVLQETAQSASTSTIYAGET